MMTLSQRCAAAGITLILLASPALAGTFTYTVVDQNGISWGDNVWLTVLTDGANAPGGGSITVPDGTYTMRVRYGGSLTKDYAGIVVDASTTSLEFVWESADVELRVVNQHGELVRPVSPANVLHGMTASLPGYSPKVINGGTVHVPINDSAHDPTIGGGASSQGNGYNFVGWFSGSHLVRQVSATVGPTTTALEMVWPTADVTFRLVDQFGADITDYEARIVISLIGSGTSPLTITDIPVNDTSLDPALASTIWADHYEYSFHAIGNGLQRGWLRWMTDRAPALKVTPGMTDFTIEWHMQDVTLRAVDQHGNPMPDINGSRTSLKRVSVVTWPYPGGYDGDTIRLPVNDPALYPSLFGTGGYTNNELASDGYDMRMTFDAGFASTTKYDLNGAVVTTSTTEIAVPWPVIREPLLVVDAAGDPVPGSTFQINNPIGGGDIVRGSGEEVTLAVTDAAAFHHMAGGFANGYPIIVTPGDTTGSGTYQFEVLENGDLLPQYFAIDGKNYGLRFQFNDPPIANAGVNLAILSSEQSVTSINGTGADPDGDAMTYRWLENGAEVQAGTVGGTGEAPLDLSLLSALALGDHTFELDVSDGQVTATDSMILTVDNSPPDLAVGGSITAEIGSDITLVGEAADFDGDMLTYTWAEGTTVLASGSLATIAGGDSVDVPAHTISGGLSLGGHVLTLTIDDGVNAPVSADVAVNVIDTTAPTMAPAADTALLWPPNHELVTVTVDLNASDNSGVVDFVASVASTENPDKDADGNTIPDWSEPTFDTTAGTMTVQLRAERSGTGTGRVYTVTITATDGSGNSTDSAIEVVCPHDRRKSK